MIGKLPDDDQVAGLQLRIGDNWITVKPAEDALIINIGDKVQVCKRMKEEYEELDKAEMRTGNCSELRDEVVYESKPLPHIHALEQQPAKRPIRETESISFTEEDLSGVDHPHNDELVITAMIGNHQVYRILIDDGSAVNILYLHAFKKMGLPKANLKPAATLLCLLTGASIVPRGVITLPITIGEGNRTTQMAEFFVVDCPSRFNVVMGRPLLVSLQAVILVYHQAMKFPTSSGVGIVKSRVS